MKLRDLAAACGLPAAKAHRYLVSLVRAGLAAQAERAGGYDLGPLALRLGLASLARGDALQRAAAKLPGLRDEIRATCFLSRWSDRGPIVLQWEDSRNPVTVIVRVGSLMPLSRSATGRVFLAYMPRNASAAVLAAEHALRPAEIEHLVAVTRAQGLGRVVGDFQPGISALSAPLFDPGRRFAGAVTALGPSPSFDAEPDGTIARSLKAFAAAGAADR